MGARERLIAGVAVAIVVLVAFWLLLVAPERNTSNSLAAQIATARTTLAGQQSQLAAGESARSRYVASVRAIKVLEAAVPLSDQEPALIRLLDALEVGHVIKWDTTTVAAGAPGSQGFDSIGLTFSFTATFARLQSFFSAIDSLTQTDGANVLAKGRLFTINSVTLSPQGHGGTSATVSMTVYQVPTTGTAPATTPAPAASTAPSGVTGVSGATSGA